MVSYAPHPRQALDLRRYDPRLPVGTPVQDGFEDLGQPLHDATFVVVDLETTGTSPVNDHITEIGAVKVRGGEVLGEFATLVNPGVPVPPRITVITGITTSMVIEAPPLEEVLPLFLEFSRGAILVAHNARFDMGFLRTATRELGMQWAPAGQVDTLALARKVVTRDEAPNHRLASLARLFGSPTAPDHRALHDARATVHVLHGLLERLGSSGVTHLEDLRTAADPVPAARRRKVHLAESLPTGPGVYLFKGPRGEVLYVGTAKNLRRRVRQYFTSAPDRRRIGEMVDLAQRVDVVECPTQLEAQVRELRLILEYAPAYNRRSKRAARLPWLRLTEEALPRPSIVHALPNTGIGIGPFPSRRMAQQALDALEGSGIRTCTRRLPLRVNPAESACILADLGKCSAPCIDQHAASTYSEQVSVVEAILTTDARGIHALHMCRIRRLASQERFEEAAALRDDLHALLLGIHRMQRLTPWWDSPLTVGARWSDHAYPQGAWEIVVAKHGRLSATATCPPGRDPVEFQAELVTASAHVPQPTQRAGAATAEETSLIADWFESPGVRLITRTGAPLAWPIWGGGAHLAALETPLHHGARHGASGSPVDSAESPA